MKTSSFFRIHLFILILFFLLPLHHQAQSETDRKPEKIKVALRQSPPFIIVDNEQYSGVSIDLWEQIAPDLQLDYEYVKYTDLGKMLSDIAKGSVDICINPLTVTSDRLNRFSFTQPFYISGMAIAVKAKEGNTILAFLKNLFSIEFLQVIILLFVVIFVFGLIIWLAERRKNIDQFGKGIKGLGHGIYWSAVTMTTVGYGDKAPSTGLGRFISIVWMFTAVIIISSFTASISAALTYNKFKTNITGISDLHNLKVGTVRNSSTASYLLESRIKHKGYETLQTAIDELDNGRLDAVVYDEPLLSYIIHRDELANRIELIPGGTNSFYFAFASKNLKFIQQINPFLLQIMEDNDWRKLLESYNLRKD